MTIPNPCTSTDQPAAEYGVSQQAPIPDAYYGKPQLPGSGPFSSDDFNGKSNVLFSPDGGSYTANGASTCSFTITCTVAAVWTYSGGSGFSSVDVPSGGSASSITFSVSTPGPGDRNATWSVHGEAFGIGRDYSLDLTALGNA